MMYLWKSDMIRFMLDAAKYGDYHKNLAAAIKRNLPENPNICEPGCGLGHLSMELAKYADFVTSVDINSDAIAAFRRIASERFKNLEILNRDIEEYSPESKHNAIVFNFFGKATEILRISKRICNGTIVVVKRSEDHVRISGTGENSYRNSGIVLEQCLESLSVPYLSEKHSFEFGQPLRSIDDALLFFKTYKRADDPEMAEDIVRSKLLETNRNDFPYYYPYTQKIKIITFKTSDIGEEILHEKDF